MTLPVVVRPDARGDMLKAKDWYDERNPGLGDRFTNAVESMLERIETGPEQFAFTWRDVRSVKVDRFPYVVNYMVLDDRIDVISVIHGSRSPRIWQKRVT